MSAFVNKTSKLFATFLFTFLILISFAPSSAFAKAETHEAVIDWNTQTIRALDMAIGLDGNIILVGDNTSSPGRVSKIDASSGATIWTTDLPTSNALAVVLGLDGNPIVTGRGQGYHTFKLDYSNGNPIWDYGSGIEENGRITTLNQNGNPVLLAENNSYITLDAGTGTRLSITSLNIQNFSVTSMIIASDGNPIVFGTEPFFEETQAIRVIKLDQTTGNPTWDTTIDAYAVGVRIKQAPDGNPIVAYTNLDPNEFSVAKVNAATGAIIWNVVDDRQTNDFMWNMTIDSSGNPLVVGQTAVGGFEGTRASKFDDSTGQPVWSILIGNGISRAIGVTLDGLTVVSGRSLSVGRTVKFSADEIPSFNLSTPVDINLGDIYEVSSSFVDSDSSTWTATVDYGDGSGVQPLTLDEKTFVLNHEYQNIGHYTVTVVIKDNQQAEGKQTVNLTVNLDGVPPECVPSGGTPQRSEPNFVQIGYSNICAAIYTGANTPDDYYFSYTTDQGTYQQEPVHYDGQTEYGFYTDNTNGNILHEVQLIYTCQNVICGTYEYYNNISGFYIVPLNSAPTINQLVGGSININNSYTESGSFDDQDSASWTATVDYGDGSGEQSLTLNGTAFDLSHTYTSAVTFTGTVVFTADWGWSDTETVEISVTDPQPVTLYPTADTFIKEGSPNQNEGASTLMRVQSSGHNRAMVKFDQSQIETAVNGAQNYTAKLQFTITDNGNNWGSTGRPLNLHRMTQDWIEGNGFIENNNPVDKGTGNGTTWNCATDSNITNGAANCSGADDWNMTNSSLWPFASAATATTTITNNQTGVVEFDVTSDVQSFISGANTNTGWLLKKENEGQTGRVEFGTKESENTPVLVITFN